jgi:hypothetical protein
VLTRALAAHYDSIAVLAYAVELPIAQPSLNIREEIGKKYVLEVWNPANGLYSALLPEMKRVRQDRDLMLQK